MINTRNDLDPRGTIVLDPQKATPRESIKITVRDVKWIDTRAGGIPLDNPFHAIECDGLPSDRNGSDITSFAIFDNSGFNPEDFLVGKTYEITGAVSGKYFNIKELLSEVASPVPGVSGVPRDADRERALNSAMMVTAQIMGGLTLDDEADAFGKFEFLYDQIVALRFSNGEQQ